MLPIRSSRLSHHLTTLLILGTVLLLALKVNAASAFFNLNTDPTANGSLSLYGSANWQSADGAGAATNASDGYLEITPSFGGERGAVVFKDFDNGAIIKAFTFEADV